MNLPKAFLEKYQNILKEDFPAFLDGFSLPRQYGLRLNALKCPDIDQNVYLKSILTKNPLVENGYFYDEDAAPGRHPYHHAGLYYIQDPSAMMVIENADILPGDVVFDMAASPGGKSTHILSKLNNDGLLIANDISSKRAKILSENMERMGAKNALVINCDPQDLSLEFDGFFDKVIVDAPCSGEGMFRKDSDALDMWSPEAVANCVLLQKPLLETAYRLVKRNGCIIYSTCTFSPEENEAQIDTLLKNHPDLQLLPTIKTGEIEDGIPVNGNEALLKCSRFYFHRFNGEGHFIAKLKKTGGGETHLKTKSKSLIKVDSEQLKYLNEFITRYLNGFKIPGDIYQFNNHLYSLFYNGILPNLDRIKIERYGLELGEIKKDRFEPSHSLALTLKPSEAKYVIDLPSDGSEIIHYLKGETLNRPGNNGFTLITVDGFSLGFAKHADNVLKNYYPKGLRIKF